MFLFFSPFSPLTFFDVVPDDGDIVVPVGPGVFMGEADGVEQFVDDDVEVEAAGAQHQRLRTARHPHVGITTKGMRWGGGRVVKKKNKERMEWMGEEKIGRDGGRERKGWRKQRMGEGKKE